MKHLETDKVKFRTWERGICDIFYGRIWMSFCFKNINKGLVQKLQNVIEQRSDERSKLSAQMSIWLKCQMTKFSVGVTL